MSLDASRERTVEDDRGAGDGAVPEIRREAAPAVARERGRLRRLGETLHWRRVVTGRGRPPAPPRSLALRLLVRFAAFVLLPTAVVAVYLFAIASDQFVARAQFAVRGNVEPMAETPVGEFAGLIQKHNSQDSFIVRDFIQSRAMAEAAETELRISALFSRAEIDPWARYPDPQPAEVLARYWRAHVTAHIEALSGVITLTVRAFSPEDSVSIANLVIGRAEALVNDISRRAQADMVEHAAADARDAEARLRRARLALQEFRNRWGLIDPAKTAEAAMTTIVLLRKDKLKAENDLRVLRGSNLDESARSVQVLAATVSALDAQMKQIQDQLTTEGLADGARTNLTQALMEFEGFKIEQTIAEKRVESMHLLLDRARIAAGKQQVYLATFVPPALPQRATYPERGSTLFITFFCCLVAWSVVSLVVSGIRDARL